MIITDDVNAMLGWKNRNVNEGNRDEDPVNGSRIFMAGKAIAFNYPQHYFAYPAFRR